jgi:predicted TIM-barrel fold metal-dependent hydrolase
MENSMKHLWRLFVISFLVVLFLANDAVSQNQGNNNRTNTHEEKLKIIDVHTHGFVSSDWKKAGVVGVVAMPGVDDVIDPYKEKYDKDTRVITCLGLEYSNKNEIKLTELRSRLATKKYGCIKIFLGYIELYAYDEKYKEVYQLAAKYDLPVVFHTGDTQSSSAKLKYADPLTIDEVAVDHPGVAFVIAHCGNPWYQTAAEVAYKNKNVFLECSALLTGDVNQPNPKIIGQTNEEREEQVKLLMVEPIKWVFNYVEDYRKVMFGSDFGEDIISNIDSYVQAYKKAIPPKHHKAVFSENAVCVYNFKKFDIFKEVDCSDFWKKFMPWRLKKS